MVKYGDFGVSGGVVDGVVMLGDRFGGIPQFNITDVLLESDVEWVISLAYILYTTLLALDEINYVCCKACGGSHDA